ncbi:MAG TPA: ankyrin repeat domain-containing protein [Vicinamibacterales bacterium]|nr:ankyrin repeat domain-containing protein [Vicinamibacterales bacterium]
MSLSRRRFFSITSTLSALGISTLAGRAWGQTPPMPYAITGADAFPQQDPGLVKDAVGASHGNFARIRELVEKQPALARASIDWGFGDWETCIDAAAHVGNKPIADFLLAHGARPTIFSAAMMGQLDAVKAFIAARPGIQKTLGPHGFTLMSHAKAGGADAAAVVQYLAGLGDADTPAAFQPLDAADRDALVGKYVYGSGPRDFFTIDVQRDNLGIDRPNGPARRNLFHLGNLVFFPMGVPTVKIAFLRESGKVTQFTVADPGVMITARRA